ncbi:MAG: hypothetical protein ACK4VM_04120, partial [Bosea sp. (in: a-proteobacteria)]
EQGVEIRTGVDAFGQPGLLTGFDHVVIATGAEYRAGTGWLAPRMLRWGVFRRWPLRALACSPSLRSWFYSAARRPRGAVDAQRLGRRTPGYEIIGDARIAGKGDAAIADAFAGALQDRHLTA